MRLIPNCKRAAFWALGVAILLVIYYLSPHTIVFKDEIAWLQVAKVEYYAVLGKVKELRCLTSNGDVVCRERFVSVDFPLYQLHRRGRWVGDWTEFYKRPGLPHWSELRVVIDSQITVVIEDHNQDGIVDRCYTRKTTWPI